MPNIFKLASIVLGLVAVPLTEASSQQTSPIELDAHVRIKNPADLDQSQANKVYGEIIERMSDGYALSGNSSAEVYQEWRRFSTAPYLSSGHGNRYVSNYGNAISSGYLELEEGAQMPQGSILAKDSFTVTDNQKVYPGALFLMEKLEAGKNPDTGDWRYVMILPDGSLFGDTTGANPDSMEFCHDCHEQVEVLDFLFGVPSGYATK